MYKKRVPSPRRKKKRIRARYKSISKDELEFIPARPKEKLFEDTQVTCCSVLSVSTDDAKQTSSYELQKNHYKEDMIKSHEGGLLKGYTQMKVFLELPCDTGKSFND